MFMQLRSFPERFLSLPQKYGRVLVGTSELQFEYVESSTSLPARAFGFLWCLDFRKLVLSMILYDHWQDHISSGGASYSICSRILYDSLAYEIRDII